MAFYFTCPYCLHRTLVSEELSGQQGPCVDCGKPVTVPAPPAPRRTDIAPAQELAHPPLVAPRRPIAPRSLIKVGLFAVFAIPVMIATLWVLSPTLVQLKKRRDVAVCKQNLQRIAKALNAYAKDYGSYPPAVVRDPSGKPMHSWRVLILPYLGEKKLYERYDMSTPWDSPQNAQMQALIPPVYISPANGRGAIGESSYMLITGPRSVFPATGPAKGPGYLRDGANNTLLVVETNNSKIPWTEPVDLDIATLPAAIGSLNGIGGSHEGGATVVFADGESGWLPSDTSKAVIDSLITPAGGESVFGQWYR